MRQVRLEYKQLHVFFFQILIMYNFMFGEENEPNDNNWPRSYKLLGEGE